MANFIEETFKTAGAELALVRGGSGKPLLILHDELGYPGWMEWNEKLAQNRTLLIPHQGRLEYKLGWATVQWHSHNSDIVGRFARLGHDQV